MQPVFERLSLFQELGVFVHMQRLHHVLSSYEPARLRLIVDSTNPQGFASLGCVECQHDIPVGWKAISISYCSPMPGSVNGVEARDRSE